MWQCAVYVLVHSSCFALFAGDAMSQLGIGYIYIQYISHLQQSSPTFSPLHMGMVERGWFCIGGKHTQLLLRKLQVCAPAASANSTCSHATCTSEDTHSSTTSVTWFLKAQGRVMGCGQGTPDLQLCIQKCITLLIEVTLYRKVVNLIVCYINWKFAKYIQVVLNL